jgi:hypothetical protein
LASEYGRYGYRRITILLRGVVLRVGRDRVERIFEPLRFVPKGKAVVLGLVTTKRPILESRDALKRRVDEAAKYVSSCVSALNADSHQLSKAICSRSMISGQSFAWSWKLRERSGAEHAVPPQNLIRMS